ncbi:putative acetyl- carboxylase [Rosellinia necatrix]|uniref:Putative acetyl-carboxylase n=1 Tax=Rosellinia necatrix TaxID=77044 RepID=A0A1S7UIM1_ROSNE|nr:putative acetyl- carboxylase [Rosellinia necatrix]
MAWLHQIPFNPRRLLQAVVVGAAALAGNGAVQMGASATDLGPGATAPVRPFRLDQVRLGNGLMQEKRDRIKAFLRAYDERKFLVLFNNQAGRTNPKGVTSPGGWEDGGLLSGHWTGHFMTALSQAYVDQGEQVFKTKLDWIITELAACQDAITARMKNGAGTGSANWVPTHPGYLGALPEDTVLRLGPPRWAVYGGDLNTNTWAPWYTQHKIIRGLLDAYYNTNSTQALNIVTKMADWAYLALTIGDKNNPKYTGNLTRDDLNYMWDLYIGGEFGGANEVFPEIYQITGDARHLQTAKAFDNRESLFGAAVQDQDILVVTADKRPGRRRPVRLHANQHVPQFIGYLRVFEQSGDETYLAAARNFYSWLVPHRHFATGGVGGSYPGTDGNGELFQNRDNVANAMASTGAETCTAYNVLKLARNLFLHEHDAAYMDAYERGLFNQIAGSRADTSSTADPQLSYFQQLTPGTRRDFGNTGTCCGGTGMESHTKYQETVYLRSADGSALWVNLYVPSTLTWAERGFTVKQETAFPRNDTAKLTVTGQGPLDIKLRVPAWALRGFEVTVNGQVQQPAAPSPGSYLTLSRTWAAGDVISVRMPFSIRIERARDRPDTQAILWGPLVLQLVGKPSSGNDGYYGLSLYRYLKRDGDYSKAAIRLTGTSAAGDATFQVATGTGTTTIAARPYHVGDAQVVSAYFRRVEPAVVFGALDAGVPNRRRNDGLPSYDVPVAGIASPGTDGPTFLDLVWDQAPFATHGAFVKVVTSTADQFVAAGVYSTQERDTIVAKASQAEKELTPS